VVEKQVQKKLIFLTLGKYLTSLNSLFFIHVSKGVFSAAILNCDNFIENVMCSESTVLICFG